ncbi:hypothetical protein DPMN_103126 [Dreissena polymorpha]|uniref:Bridge-like lipid transfer protein family member 1 C-terminal domain-containing protein n=1 Tax=Dreissena polymorpha TaxID=45954 RepID=A0A9D4JYW9_DREPO|nr:hypothetical protein DPMN_103126 [Dreissena polymorpha]
MLRFEEQESKLSLYDKFVSGKQDTQNIVTYVEKVQAVGQRLGRSDKEVFDQIVHGLDDDVKKLVFLKDVTNVVESVKLAKMAEGSKASVNQTTAFTKHNSRGTGRQARPMFKQAYDTPGRRQPHEGRRQAGRCEHCGRDFLKDQKAWIDFENDVVEIQGGLVVAKMFASPRKSSLARLVNRISIPPQSVTVARVKVKGTHIVQDLTFYVGHDHTSHLDKPMAMAYVLKMSRGHAMPPTFTSAHAWFNYAFATSEIKDLDEFPRMQRAGSESPSERKRKFDYSHESEVIFALPSLQLQLRTKHHQAEMEPVEDDPKPVVECSFVTEFEDHIYVAMDAEILLFLHDLVMSYIKEKDKSGARGSIAGASSKAVKSPVEGDKKKVIDPVTVLQQDWREYQCKTWQLEPTVRFLHWASRQIDPVGVDYVLQKLGFTHARVTIPKWMQRGFMDPSDKILSMLVNKVILILRDPKVEEKT